MVKSRPRKNQSEQLDLPSEYYFVACLLGTVVQHRGGVPSFV